MIALAVLVALASAPSSAIAPGVALAPAPSRAVASGVAKSVRGVVRQVADERAYLTHGARDGLALGAKVALGNGLFCEVEHVADSAASCLGPRLRAGMRYTFVPAPVTSLPSRAPLVPVDGEAVRAGLASVPFPLVRSKRSSRTAARARAMVVAGTRATAVLGTADSVFVQPSIDLFTEGPLFLSGLSGGLALRATGDALAPKNQRFRANEPVQLYVYRASLVYEDVDADWRIEAGRFFPEAPGVEPVDGIQASSAVLPTLRLGVVGGVVPSLTALAPADHFLVNGFASWRPALGPLDVVADARVGATSAFAFDAARLDAEVRGLVRYANLASADVGIAAGVASDGAVSLQRALVLGSVSPVPSVRVFGGYRFHGPASPDFDLGVFPVLGAHHADLDVDWDALPFFTAGVRSGVVAEANGAVRGYAGPAFVFRLGGVGNELVPSTTRVSVSWLEELSLFAGRSVLLDVDTILLENVALRNGLAYFETTLSGVDALREIGASVGVHWSPLPWLSLAARGFGQQALPAFDATPRQTPLALTTDLQLTSRF